MIAPVALADADGDPFLGVVVGGRFAVLEILGAGSMGTVYRARQEAMGRDVALKIVRSDRLVDAQSKTRFQQEAHATSLLTSPHTVTVFDFGEVGGAADDPEYVDGSLYLAMELLEGSSLGAQLKKSGRVPVGHAITILRHTLSSLAEAHAKGVIHRDLKPDNLLLTHDVAGKPTCKVLDFGIAKLLTRDGGIDALETQAGTVFGTPRYMSPEQAQGKKLDARSDLYSLGVILYHMLAGRPPFTDGDAVVVMAHHIKTVPKPPSQVVSGLRLPSDLEALLMRVLDKNPDNRPQSAEQLIELLDGLSLEVPRSDATSGALAAVVDEPKSRPRPSRRVVMAGAAVMVVGALAVGRVLAGDGGPRRVTVSPAFGLVAQSVLEAAKDHQIDHARREKEAAIKAAENAAAAASANSSASGSVSGSESAPATSPRPPVKNTGGYQRWDRPR